MADRQLARDNELLSETARDAVNAGPRRLAWAALVCVALSILALVLGLQGFSDSAGEGNDSSARGSHSRTENVGAATLHPQCSLPYEMIYVNATPTCYGRGWRLQNRRLWPQRSPRSPGDNWRPRLHCDQVRAGADMASSHSVKTGVGGGQWYRFVHPVGLPTEPQRQVYGASELFDAFSCGTGATAWVSGWEPANAQRPPRDYREPGTLPGDGPQWPDAQWQQRVICFEGTASNYEASTEPMIPGVLWEAWYDAYGTSVDDLVDGDIDFPEWPTLRGLISPADPHPWGPNCGGTPFRQDASVDPDSAGDCKGTATLSASGVGATGPEDRDTGTSRATAVFESPTDIADHLGTRMRSYFRAPETGDYTFVLSSDDFGELWLGNVADTNGDTEQVAEMVASVPGWTEPREWTKYPEQTSRPLRLRAGVYYTLDSLAKENAGGDNLAVGVSLPSGIELRPIPVEFDGTGLLFVDPIMRLYSVDRRGNTDPVLQAALERSEYQSCMSYVRASAVHCGEYILWKLPDVPSCDPVPMAYAGTPESGLF